MKNANQHKVLTEGELLEKLEKSREQAAQGMFRDADEFVCELREKYGLQRRGRLIYMT